jgi:hypothetical protein
VQVLVTHDDSIPKYETATILPTVAIGYNKLATPARIGAGTERCYPLKPKISKTHLF